ncbi:hypothetical protein O181_111659 [Austropuccinia psidii MF-1]|uniref:Uncharacterized protein n=1 Tax=Austropuccinia psidii MF-1 TaxID=1389203 RepID=A0A9Q3K2E8_9BASI|nr:hypothetical protein [Austropuccinia psidii MF-1]
MLDKVEHHAQKVMDDNFDYAKQKWDKSHKVPDFKVGDIALISTLTFNNIKGLKSLKDSYVGHFVIVALHVTNVVQVGLSGELENEHPTPLALAPVEQSEDKKIKRTIKEMILRGKNQREYLFRYRNKVDEDEWLEESQIPDSDKLLSRFRHEEMSQV